MSAPAGRVPTTDEWVAELLARARPLTDEECQTAARILAKPAAYQARRRAMPDRAA